MSTDTLDPEEQQQPPPQEEEKQKKQHPSLNTARKAIKAGQKAPKAAKQAGQKAQQAGKMAKKGAKQLGGKAQQAGKMAGRGAGQAGMSGLGSAASGGAAGGATAAAGTGAAAGGTAAAGGAAAGGTAAAAGGATAFFATPPGWITLGVIVVILLIMLIILFTTQNEQRKSQQNDDIAALTITKDGPDEAKVGDELKYTITITSDENAVSDITITDKLPEGTEYVESSWKAHYNKTTHTVTWLLSENENSSDNIYFNVDTSFTLTLKATKNNENLVNQAEAIATAATCGVGGGDGKTIVIDPGHSGSSVKRVDTKSGITDYDYPNKYENEEMFYVALKVKEQLTKAGYKVILTKGDNLATTVTGVNDPIVKQGGKLNAYLRARADVANNNNAALAVSLHDYHKPPFDQFAEIYVQKSQDGTELYRIGNKGEVTFVSQFANKAAADVVANASQKAGEAIKKAREAAEGRNVTIKNANFGGRGEIAGGNIHQVQLYSQVPWVYNEVGGPVAGYLTKKQLDAYATGVANGIKAAVPADGAGGAADCAGGDFGGKNVPPSNDTCNGVYKAWMDRLKTINKTNYGDPKCELVKKDPNGKFIIDKDKILTYLKTGAKLSKNEAEAVYFCIIPKESSYNSNAWNPDSTSAKRGTPGAFGNFQMNAKGYENANQPEDVGDVVWQLQIHNAINWKNKYNKGKWSGYWPQTYQGCLAKYGE